MVVSGRGVWFETGQYCTVTGEEAMLDLDGLYREESRRPGWLLAWVDVCAAVV